MSSYEYEKNYFTAEQEFKVKTIERIKKGENKQILKEHKMSKNMIESGLMGSGHGSYGFHQKYYMHYHYFIVLIFLRL